MSDTLFGDGFWFGFFLWVGAEIKMISQCLYWNNGLSYPRAAATSFLQRLGLNIYDAVFSVTVIELYMTYGQLPWVLNSD